MNINIEQNTTSATQQDIITVAEHSSFETQSSTRRPDTVADLQRNLGSNTTGTIGGTTPDADKKVLNDILRTIKSDERRRLWFYQLLLFFLCPITFTLMMFCCANYWRHISGTERVAKGGIRYMIRLEGDQWSRYVQHLLVDSPRKMKKETPKRLLARGYGHVLLGPEGFFLDALLGATYENLMAVRTEVIRAPNGIDMMLRLWFCQRVVPVARNRTAPMNMNNDPLKFDIFLPPTMPTERVTSIINFIMNGSKCLPHIQSQQYSFQI